VYLDIDTRRILAFSPEHAKPKLPAGIRWRAETCYSAAAIERYASQYREQCRADEEMTSVRRLEAERPFREAVRDSILERNKHCDPRNVALNNALLRTMDHFYMKALNRRKEAEVAITAELYEEKKLSTEIALDSPHGVTNA